VVAPKIKELLKRHRSRPIGARVTLTSGKMDVKRIYQHLTEETASWEVGFAPVTTAPNRGHAISDHGYDEMLGQFRDLAYEFLEARSRTTPWVFKRQRDARGAPQRRQQGVPVQAPGLGLLAWPPTATSHSVTASPVRFPQARNGSRRHRPRRAANVSRVASRREPKPTAAAAGRGRSVRAAAITKAHTRYGETTHANLHYCDWIRGWTDVCLKIYGELAVRNPAFLAQFDDEAMKEPVS